MLLKHRRFGGSRTRQLRPQGTTIRITKTLKFESLNTQRRAKRFLVKTGTTPYPTLRQRELFNFKKTEAKTKNINYKGRFARLPLKVLKRAKAIHERRSRAKHITNFSGQTEALMQIALKRRFVARRIRDLRKAGQKRKLPSNKRLPF